MNKTPLAESESTIRGQITLEDVKKMGDKELRIAIAKLRDWTDEQIAAWKTVRDLKIEQSKLPRPRDSFSGWSMIDKIEKAQESENYNGSPPDYPHDLNAVHSIEKDAGFHELRSGLNWNPRPGIKYRSWLRVIAGDEGSVIADARQRCEALVLCLSERGENAICRQPSNPDRAKGVSNL